MKTPALHLILSAALLIGLSCNLQAQESAKKAGAVPPIKDPVVLLEELPKDLIKELTPSEKKFEENIAKANPIISAKVMDKPCEFDGIVGYVEKRFEQGTSTMAGYTVVTRTVRIRSSGTVFLAYHSIDFDKSESDKVAKLKNGQKVRFTGTTSGASFLTGSQAAFFMVGVKNGKLK